MTRTWIIRGGEENRLVDEFVDSGVVGVGYPQLGDATSLAFDVVLRALGGPDDPSAVGRAGRFRQFLKDMAVGDVVLMPDTPRSEVVIGIVNGPYEYWSSIDPVHFRHRHRVRWVGRVALDQLPDPFARLHHQRQTLIEVQNPQSLAPVLKRAMNGELGEPKGRSRITRTTSARVRDAGKRSPEGRVCSTCFCKKTSSQFAPESEECRDCRA